MTALSFRAAPLDPAHGDEAMAIVLGAGVHGVYVANDLAQGSKDGEAVALYGEDGMLGVLWFGRRGNLIVVHGDGLDSGAVALAIQRAGWPWRIVLGPAETVGELARRAPSTPLVDRTQLYYRAVPRAAEPSEMPEGFRAAHKGDVAGLLEAALRLNEDDLGVERSRVDVAWLRRNVRSRIGDAATWVIGPPAQVYTKLDYGSWGPYGLVIEGVYTFPDRRGQGLAAALVRACIDRAHGEFPVVCLHVGEGNHPARRCYERAGMEDAGRCRLVLL